MPKASKHLEIERRFLLRGLPGPEILLDPATVWTQLTTVFIEIHPRFEVRIRRRWDGKEATYPIVTKYGSGISRQESPKILGDEDLFDYYLLNRKCPFHAKDHWEVPLPVVHKAEISKFLRPDNTEGLCLLEIEFENETAAGEFKLSDLPDWLQNLVIKEVTDDPAYNGKNLAVHGAPEDVIV